MFALDYDGVISDTNSIKASWIKERLGIDIPIYECDRTTCVPLIGEEQYNKMSEDVYGRELSLQAKPVLGVYEALETLTRHGPLYVITARKEDNLAFAHEWLKKNDLEHFIDQIISLDNNSKITIAENLSCKVLIDDDKRHLLSNPNTKILLILIKIGLKNFEKRIKYNGRILLCTTWRDFVFKSLNYAG